jgi:hypothetical protein
MARTESITVDGVTYGVGWNEEGWFAYRDDGVSTRSYCATLDELRQAVADGDWELSELEDMVDDSPLRDDERYYEDEQVDLAALYSEIGGEGGGA